MNYVQLLQLVAAAQEVAYTGVSINKGYPTSSEVVGAIMGALIQKALDDQSFRELLITKK